MSSYPVLLHTAIDARDCRGLGEFYRQFLGRRYRDGEEPPADGSRDDGAWLVLLDEDGNRVLTSQEKDRRARTGRAQHATQAMAARAPRPVPVLEVVFTERFPAGRGGRGRGTAAGSTTGPRRSSGRRIRRSGPAAR